MTRLGIAAGANPLTFAGLAGMGDLIATCGSHLSRNHRLGEELAKGRTWAEIEATLPGTAEGAYTVQAALALAERLRRRDADRPRGRAARCSRARASSAASSTCSPRESKDELADYGRWMARLESGAEATSQRGRPRRSARGRVLDSGFVGAWRSLVAHQSGGLVVVGSNPAAPTKYRS